MLKSKSIKSSIFEYFRANYGGSTDWGNPSHFDPDSESVQSWVAVFVDLKSDRSGRRANDEGSLTIRFDINSRKQNNRYEPETLHDAVRAIIDRGGTIPVYDYDDSAEPVVGWVRFNESTLRDTTEEDSEWKTATMTIESSYQEI